MELEQRLAADVLTSEERKTRQLQQHGKRESQYLRLRRTKIGLNDFRTVKVIGKGAFGEVRVADWSGLQLWIINLSSCALLGSFGTEDRFRKDICHEDFTESGDVEAGSGTNTANRSSLSTSWFPKLNIVSTLNYT